MAICKPAKPIKVQASRQNSQRIGPSLTQYIRAVSKRDGIHVQLPPPVQETPSSAGASTENASEWNSLLISARAQRGPFWDVSTQQFLVEKDSELYYDSTSLIEACRPIRPELSSQQASSNNPSSSNAQQTAALAQQRQHHHQQQIALQQQQLQQQQIQQRQAFANAQQIGSYSGGPGTPTMGHASPVRGGGYPGTPGAGGQYYDMTSPTRPGMVNGMSAAGSPEIMYGRRVTRGMSDSVGGVF